MRTIFFDKFEAAMDFLPSFWSGNIFSQISKNIASQNQDSKKKYFLTQENKNRDSKITTTYLAKINRIPPESAKKCCFSMKTLSKSDKMKKVTQRKRTRTGG